MRKVFLMALKKLLILRKVFLIALKKLLILRKVFLMALKKLLILRRPRSGRLEGRTVFDPIVSLRLARG
jgi:hypothetical protein